MCVCSHACTRDCRCACASVSINNHDYLFSRAQDLRKETVATTFGGHMDSVRDVQFNPHHYFMFASAYENGNIQVTHSVHSNNNNYSL